MSNHQVNKIFRNKKIFTLKRPSGFLTRSPGFIETFLCQRVFTATSVNVSEYVQKYNDQYDVFFQDEEILQSFGGLVSLDSNGKFKSAKGTKADDAKKFYKLDADQLK